MTDLVEILRELRLRLKGTVGSDHWACGKRSGLKQAINIISLPRPTALEQSTLEIKELREALELFTGQAVFDPHTHRASVDEFVVSKARAALNRHSSSVGGE